MKAVIILPTYNERENITSMLTLVSEVITTIKTYQCTILVVDDTSPDGTGKEVAVFQKKHANVLCITGKKEGLGRALLRGMDYAIQSLHADVIVQMDADLSHDPHLLPEFFKKLDQGADFVVGSRYIPGGSIPAHWGWHRKVYSILGNAIVRFGLGKPSIHDWTGGYRVFRKEFFEKAKSHIAPYSGYVFQIAFLHNAVCMGAKVAEVPIHFADRRFGKSKIAPLEYIVDIYRYIGLARFQELINGPFLKFAIVGTIGFVINTAILELFVKTGLHPAAGSAVGAEFAIISNFILNNAWTFGDRKVTGLAMAPKFIQFNVTSFGALVIQTGSVWIGTSAFGAQSYFVSYIAGVALGLIWNYTMYSKVIWKNAKS